MKAKQLDRYLYQLGYKEIRNNGHAIYSNGVYSIAVPNHRIIARGTLRDIFKLLYPGDPGLANEQMRKALRGAA